MMKKAAKNKYQYYEGAKKAQVYYPGLGGPGSQMLGKEEEKEVLEVLRSRILARDRFESVRKHFKVRSFEDRFKQYMGTKHALAVSNATQGLVIAMHASGIGPGDEVIVPAYTFIATAAAVVAVRAIPILAEVDQTLGLDPKDVEKKITSRTKCILPVHMKGAPCRMDQLLKIKNKYGLKMVEDVAQACGGSYKGKMLGSFGDAGVFSFDYWKIITTGGGGMITTSDTNLYKTCVHYHDHGHEVYREHEDLGERPLIGLNFRMEELEGAVGLAQLAKLKRIVQTMRRNSERIFEGIKNLGPFMPRKMPDSEGHIGNGVTLIMKNAALAERFFKKMVERGVEMEWLKESGWHNYNNWKQLLKKKTINKDGCPFTCPHYTGKAEYHEGMCPQTDDLLTRAVTIRYNATLYMTAAEIKSVIQHVKEVCRELKE
jgi:8-amino-3,8-dideoxy-alpha-D-manno-octulosonate transaminase